jgi:predicted ATP-binding protein involved in virulence
MLRINEIKIEAIGPIKKLELSFNNDFNIICGQNGVGKTTILDCLAQAFSAANSSLKKMAGEESGKWGVGITSNGNSKRIDFQTESFLPSENIRSANGFYKEAKQIVVFKTHRDIEYKKLSSLANDKLKSEVHFYQETVSGSTSNDIKNWIVNRYLFSAQKGSLDANQLKNYELVKECFCMLDEQISFSRVEANSFDVLLKRGETEVYFEYLSSGFKSCLAVILGIIMEVELRFKSPSVFVKDFDGIVFIDEVDLHLHPEWQAKIYNILKEILPKAQIFTSTHSPHIIQVANPKEIIPLTLDENNEVKLNLIINKEYGCQGWTVEEILTDVMGMEETRTSNYLDAISNFNSAIDDDDFRTAEAQFDILDSMLHQENSLRKILKIQLTGLSQDD